MIKKIGWIDSWSVGGWQQRSECHGELLRCETVGFVVEETDDFICLALSRSKLDGYLPYCDLITIPKVSILNSKDIFDD